MPLQTVTSFTLTLSGLTRVEELARTTWALKANSVKLPQLTTSDQSTMPPQRAGNLVLNADQQAMAVHNGSRWPYCFKNPPVNS